MSSLDSLGSLRLGAVVEVGESAQKEVDDKRSRARARLLADVIAYIRDSGDGAFALFLGDALHAVPEVAAHVEQLTEAQIAWDNSPAGRQWFKECFKNCRGLFAPIDSSFLGHENPSLLVKIASMPHNKEGVH